MIRSAKLDGMSGPDVLGIAASQGRILVTHDFRTMPKQFAEFLAAATGRQETSFRSDCVGRG